VDGEKQHGDGEEGGPLGEAEEVRVLAHDPVVDL